MTENKRYARALRAVQRFLIFFAMTAILITCCMTLFITVLASSLNVSLDEGNVNLAAKLTFINVIFLSVVFTVVDIFSRKFTVDRQVKRITDAARRITKGDFSARIPVSEMSAAYGGFGEIAECFNSMAEELSGLETLRDDFVANVSHEMRTPLSVIQNYGILLSSSDISEEARHEYASAIISSSRKLSLMMTNILKLSRLENQQIFPVTRTFDLGEQLCECLIGFEDVWESKQIILETSIAENIRVNLDPELLSLVWNNLFSNAFKFTDKCGTVKVKLRADEEYAEVVVEDTGCGMSSEDGAHIFEKFYQADSSRSTQGNGLGLALVKRVVDIMHGEISVESKLGVGSVFTVRIYRGEYGEN